MRDSYRYNIIQKHLERMKVDEYHIPRITGADNIAPINLDKGALQLLSDYYKGKELNTKMHYLYRDAANYKTRNTVVLSGEITEDQIKAIVDCLDSGEYFIPEQVGLPADRGGELDMEHDHCWFELDSSSFDTTEAPPTIDMAIEELVSAFQKAKNKWDDINYPKELYGEPSR